MRHLTDGEVYLDRVGDNIFYYTHDERSGKYSLFHQCEDGLPKRLVSVEVHESPTPPRYTINHTHVVLWRFDRRDFFHRTMPRKSFGNPVEGDYESLKVANGVALELMSYLAEKATNQLTIEIAEREERWRKEQEEKLKRMQEAERA